MPIQPAWDVVFATALLYVSGGWLSPFVLLFPFAIIGAAILLHRSGALATATAASLAYGLLVALQVNGLLHPLNPFDLEWGSAGMGLTQQLVFHILAFYSVAFLSGHLAEELRRAGQRLEQARGEIVHLEQLQQAMLRSMSGGLLAFDTGGRILFVNTAGREMLAAAGVDASDAEAVGRVFNIGKMGRDTAEVRSTPYVFGYTVSSLHGTDGIPLGTILSFQDLTELRRLEEELARSDRLAAVGRLAAGLAHEIRNPLASLSGSVEMLRASAAAGERDRQLLSIVAREADRLNHLVSDFLLYARPAQTRLLPFDFAEFLDDMSFFFRQGEGRDCFRLVNEVAKGTPLRADREQMEQLFLNLFRNSAEAAPQGVTVTVAAQRTRGAFFFTVSDDGPGVPPHVASTVFEPFISTKPEGTGLGLAMVHRIAQNHKGTVTLEASPQGGASFRFRFEIDPTWNASS